MSALLWVYSGISRAQHKLSSDALPQVAGVPFSDSASAPVPKFLAHSSSDSHVGYIAKSQKVGSHKNSGMPSQYLAYPEVANSQRIHL